MLVRPAGARRRAAHRTRKGGAPMIALLALLGIALAPLGVTWATLQAFRWLAERSGSWRSAASAAARHPPESLGRLVDELRRLEQEYTALERMDGPSCARRAVALAYDETLRRCCAALDLSEPGPPPLDGLVRLQVEAALSQRGLSW